MYRIRDKRDPSMINDDETTIGWYHGKQAAAGANSQAASHEPFLNLCAETQSASAGRRAAVSERRVLARLRVTVPWIDQGACSSGGGGECGC